MFRLSEVDARFSIGLLVFTPKTIIGFGIRGWYKILLRAIGFHPEETLYGASVIRVGGRFSFGPLVFTPKRITLPMGFGNLCFMQDPPSGYWTSPRSKARLYVEMIILWSYGILFGLRYWLAFGYWCTWHGCTEASIPLRQAKRGVIGTLQVNATWRNEPRACEAELPAASFGLSS